MLTKRAKSFVKRSSERKLTELIFWVATGFAPILLFCLVAFSANVYPFGTESFLTEDLKYQYIDFYAWFKSVLSGEMSIFYSNSLSLGQNMWGIVSYYLASPFMLLLPLFGEENLTDFAFITTALKLTCIQFTTSCYLLKRFRLPKPVVFLLALCFTFSSWTGSQLRNPMWLDVLALLPLICLGVYAFVTKKRWKLLLGCLAASIIVCWYIAYMAILFSFCYFVFEYYLFATSNSQHISCHNGVTVIKHTSQTHNASAALPIFNWGSFFHMLAHFLGLCLLAVLLAAFMFLPTASTYLGSSSSLENTSLSTSSSLAKSVIFLIVLSMATALAVLVSRTTYASSKTKKVLLVLFLVGAFMAVYVIDRFTPCTFATSGLRDILLNFIPGFWSSAELSPQLSSSIIIIFAGIYFFCNKLISSNVKLATAVLLAFLLLSVYADPLYVVWCGFREPNGFFCRNSFAFIFASIWMAAYAFEHYEATRRGSASWIRSAVYIPLMLLIACELGVAQHLQWVQLYTNYSQAYHEQYVKGSRQTLTELSATDPGIYRFAKDYARAGLASRNEGLAQGYNDLSSYTSSYNVHAIDFINALGYSRVGEFSVSYTTPILASDALLGVRYASNHDGMPPGYHATSIIDPNSDTPLYENPYALNLGYMVSAKATTFDLGQNANPFERQNALISALVGTEVNIYQKSEATLLHESKTSQEWSVVVPADSIGYAFASLSGSTAPFTMLADTLPATTINGRWNDAIQPLAPISQQATTEHVFFEGYPADATITPLLYYLDTDAFAYAINKLAQNQFSITTFENGYLEGQIEASTQEARNNLLMLTIPVDRGWHITVNGCTTQAVPLADGALTGIRLDPGCNTVTMFYISPGFLSGLVISIVTFCVLIFVCWRRKRARK